MKRNILRSLLLCTTVFGTTILTFTTPSFAYAQEPVTSDSLYQRPEQSSQVEEDTKDGKSPQTTQRDRVYGRGV